MDSNFLIDEEHKNFLEDFYNQLINEQNNLEDEENDANLPEKFDDFHDEIANQYDDLNMELKDFLVIK